MKQMQKLKEGQVWYNCYTDKIYLCKPISNVPEQMILEDEYRGRFFIAHRYANLELTTDWVFLGKL